MSQFLLKSNNHVSQQICEQIRGLIVRGGCRRGDPLPSYRELAKRFQVSLVSVKRAMDELHESGIVHIQHGKGVFVGKALSPKARKLSQAGIIFYCSRQLVFSTRYLMEIFQGILLQSELSGVDARLFSVKSEGPLPPEEVETSGVDGVILIGLANEAYLEAFARHHLPAVVVDSASQQNLDHVVADNEQDAARAVEHLIKLGHRRIAYLDGWSTDTIRDTVIETSDVRERREGFLKAMKAHGLSGPVYRVINGDPEESIRRTAALWKNDAQRPTAVVAYDVNVAAQFGRALHELNVKIPAELSLIAIAGAETEWIGDVELAFNRVDFVGMGRRAVETLASRCRQLRPAKPAYWRVGSVFHAGNSIKIIREGEIL
jgi:DNA-binding LacI/PurR family transcriptional regulator